MAAKLEQATILPMMQLQLPDKYLAHQDALPNHRRLSPDRLTSGTRRRTPIDKAAGNIPRMILNNIIDTNNSFNADN